MTSTDFTGGGFFVKPGGVWTLRGMVSAGSTDIRGECDVNRSTLFTNLPDFADWIKTEIVEKHFLSIDSDTHFSNNFSHVFGIIAAVVFLVVGFIASTRFKAIQSFWKNWN